MTLGQIIKAYRETNSMSMDDFSKASNSIYKESCKRNVYDV